MDDATHAPLLVWQVISLISVIILMVALNPDMRRIGNDLLRRLRRKV